MYEERFLKIPSLVIHPDSLIMFSKLEYLPGHSPNRKFNHLVKSIKHTHHVLSIQAKRKIDKAIKYLIYMAHDKEVYSTKTKKRFTYKVGFITLTLSSAQIHTDKEIQDQLLHQFLVECKTKWKVSRYVWKAEYQRNGNIHFHILVDRYIPYQELRNCWNRIQNKLGYIDRAIYKNPSYNYNSTDIHSLYKVNDVCKYITKYMSKSTERGIYSVSRNVLGCNRYDYSGIAVLTGQVITSISVSEYGDSYVYDQCISDQRKSLHSVSNGAKLFLKSIRNRARIWGCSVELSKISGYTGMLEHDFDNELSAMRKDSNVIIYDKDYYSIFYFRNGYISNQKYPHLFTLFNTYLSSTFQNASKQLIIEEFT